MNSIEKISKEDRELIDFQGLGTFSKNKQIFPLCLLNLNTKRDKSLWELGVFSLFSLLFWCELIGDYYISSTC